MKPALVFSAVAALATATFGADDIIPGPYKLGPDSNPQPGVAAGHEEKLDLATSRIFPGANHDCWIYVPVQYDPAKPACVMVFQDGGGYVKRDGTWRVPVVFDNLIAKKEMPVTIGIFINPGVVPAAHANALPRFNRSFEYDSLGGAYARFLIDEVLPEVKKKWKLSDDPNDRAIAGASSGAICAFTAAWERPDAFRRVFSTIGTYVGLRGGHNYPTLIRKTAPKPIRIFLQDGVNDLNIYGGDWWMANQEMNRALTFAGYEVNHAWGEAPTTAGSAGKSFLMRSAGSGRAGPPRSRRAPPAAGRMSVAEWCDLSRDWELVAEGFRNTEGPTANSRGELFFTDSPNQRIHKVGLDGKVSLFAGNTDGADGLMFGPDNKLYATTQKKNIIAFDDTEPKPWSPVASPATTLRDSCRRTLRHRV